MKKHLGYVGISSGVFFLSTTLVLLITGAGPQVEGLLPALQREGVIWQVLIHATLFGTFTGAMATLIFRKSMNHRAYTWITIILMMIFTQIVILAIL
ncbi:MAG: hypothetical protein ACO263_09280 [Cyclobacteriaceae bacterium]